MKTISIILLATFLTGCAAKKTPTAHFTTTPGCVHPVQQQNAYCAQVSEELYECNHLLVKVSCVKVKNPSAGQASFKAGEHKATP